MRAATPAGLDDPDPPVLASPPPLSTARLSGKHQKVHAVILADLDDPRLVLFVRS